MPESSEQTVSMISWLRIGFRAPKIVRYKKVLMNIVCYHCGGWLEEVNACFLNSYMVYL